MGLFDGFPFKSREQQEKESKEFARRVFPFGLEEQREAVRQLLRPLVSPRLDDQEMLFAFISAKDKYIDEEKSEEGLQLARGVIRRQPSISEQDREIILAAVRLEAEAVSLDDYPTPEQVRAALAAQETE